MKSRRVLHRSQSMYAHPQIPLPIGKTWAEMSGSMVEMLGTTPRMGRRSMALADIDPKYVSQSGIWEASEVETSRGSIRIQHLTTAAVSAGARPIATAGATSGIPGSSSLLDPRFRKLEECAHFHYDTVELPSLKILVRDEVTKPISGSGGEELDKCSFAIEVVSGGQSWIIRRTHANIFKLDEQLHRCVWDRSFSLLEIVESKKNCNGSTDEHDVCRTFVERYFARLTELPTNQITCGTVLSWFELDNRARHIVASDDSAINTPAVAAACALRKYTAQAADEISFEVGDMISVIDMPPPEESIWWRGKRGFHVGFFPRDCVQVIGDKVPASLPIVPSKGRLQQRLSVSSTHSASIPPAKPVLRKHGKLIAFFRSFILSRPSRRRLKQTGILRERVFGCDLAEHLLNTGNEIPAVLKCCAEFIEMHGIVDGIYRLSGITSDIQKLRNAFDEDKVPNLEEDEAIRQDIHSVSSLLKMYFRELPNPLCTYQLYDKFVAAAQASDADRLFRMREVVHELPPPHYRTLEYLMKHLSRVATKSNETGMTPKNMAIVWAPNLIRCKELESGGVAALKGIGVQAVVTEYLVRHADLIFSDKLPKNLPPTTTLETQRSNAHSLGRPKSLAISSPIRLMSLEEAQDKAKDDRKYIEVGGGPSSLPPKYHTVIELPGRRSTLKNKRSPMGWKNFFSRNRSFSKPRKAPTPCEISAVMKNMPVGMLPQSASFKAGRLRPVKSVESLVSSPMYQGTCMAPNPSSTTAPKDSTAERSGPQPIIKERSDDSSEDGSPLSKSAPSPTVTTSDVQVVFHPPPQQPNKPLVKVMSTEPRPLQNPKTHNRSISHDSYFEFGEFRNGNNVYIDETLEEETMSQESSKLSLDNLSSSGLDSNNTSPRKDCSSSGFAADRESSVTSQSQGRSSFRSPVTPPPSAASVRAPMTDSYTSAVSSSSDDYFFVNETTDEEHAILSKSPTIRNNKGSRANNKWRDSVVVEEDPSSPPSVYGSRCNTNEEDNNTSTLNNIIRFKDAVFALQEEPECSQFSFKPLPSSTSFTSTKYELDKNSSVDESSAESTPGEPYAGMTNIIYSPLVNEFSSPTTTASSSCEQLVVKCNPIAMQTGSLFICPLYEAGVQSSDSAATKATKVSTSTPSSLSQTSDASATHGVGKSNIPQYENVVLPQDAKAAAVTAAAVGSKESTPPLPPVRPERHVYQNERHYENHPLPRVKKVVESDKSAQVLVNEDSSAAAVSEDVYGSEHYENVSDAEEEKGGPSYGGSNIYEDIDDEHNSGTPAVKMDGKNNYETVKVCTSRPESAMPIAMRQTTDSICDAVKDGASDDNDGEEATYESVQYGTSNGAVGDHYSEIVEKAEPCYAYVTNAAADAAGENKRKNSSEESSESQSHTEDMVTYLEVQTPAFLKLHSDSIEEQDLIGEETYAEASEPPSMMTSPVVPESGEIRHIDSPGVVENPLYGIEGSNNKDEDHSLSSVCSIKIDLAEEDNGAGSKPVKVLGRCNSAPLTDTNMCDMGLSVTSECSVDDDGEEYKDISIKSDGALDSKPDDCSNNNTNSKILLCKRLSEPSLLFNSPGKPKVDERSAAWKIADAKRLANRKQSVRELLSRFESSENGKADSGQMDSINNNNTSHQQQAPVGPGLPRPDSRQNLQSSNNNFVKTNNNNNIRLRNGGGGSGRFQHHRFSMGDILSHSMSGEDELGGKTNVSSMVRSDTYPELRMEASKENEDADSFEGGPAIEKSQTALRVAMSSVDMNDPSTRERIEKYKEERRNFLRQKITSEISLQKPSSGESRTSVNSAMSPDRDSVSSCDSVFTSTSIKIVESSAITAPPPPPTARLSESPRKRAFSEDVPSQYVNQTKAIKTELFPVKPSSNVICNNPVKNFSTVSSSESLSSPSQGCDDSESIIDEVNVKEKVALWATTQKQRACSTGAASDNGNLHRSSTKDEQQAVVARKPILKEAVSLPPEGFTKLPVLRKEVTSASMEISKTSNTTTTKLRSSSVGGGKKIKDMAAFFEGKQF